jgi:cell division protein FtsQ
MWLRDSQLVAVDDVVVTGASGPQAGAIRACPDHRRGRHDDAARARERPARRVGMYPIVRDVRVQRDLPHGLRITVLQYVPVAAIQAGGRRTPVAADLTVLRGADADGLPVVAARTAPGDRRLDHRTARAVALLAAAPAPLRARVERVAGGSRGWTATLRDGPMLVFGVAERRAREVARRRAGARRPVLRGATYLDVRLPERPAAGGLVDPVAQAKADAPPQAAKQGPAAAQQAAPAQGQQASPAPAQQTSPAPAQQNVADPGAAGAGGGVVRRPGAPAVGRRAGRSSRVTLDLWSRGAAARTLAFCWRVSLFARSLACVDCH